MIDPRAKAILFKTYWSAKGWKVPRSEPSPADFQYAKLAAVMFDAVRITHDEAIDRIIATQSLVDVAALTSAFVAGLTSRQVHLRPALGSYFALRDMATHRFVGDPTCRLCGQFREWEHDFSTTNFARLKWGALPRAFAVDHAFILERFAVEPAPLPSATDRALLERLLTAADGLPAEARARDLERAWTRILPSSRAERDMLVEILVIAGVLVPSRQTERDVSRVPLKSNWSDGAALWRGDDGVARRQAETLFAWRSKRPA